MELARITKRLFSAILLLFISAVIISAQTNVEQAVKNAREQSSDIKNRSIELERMKREAGKRPISGDSSPKFPEIKEDFEEIQKTNSEFLQPAGIKTPVNSAAILKFASEINRRAARLKSNLFLTEVEQNKEASNNPKIITASSDIKTLLAALDKSIDSFVHNPMFENIKLLNLQDSLDAQKNLETVIKVSFWIREKAKKLKKEDSKK